MQIHEKSAQIHEKDLQIHEKNAQIQVQTQEIRELQETVSALELDRQTGIFRREAWEGRARDRLKVGDLIFILVDLDGLKPINDKFGHPVGDKAISLLISAFREELRETDLIGRYGLGDEFLLALDNPAGQKVEEIRYALERIRGQFEETAKTYFELELKAKDIFASFSFGIISVKSWSRPDDARERASDARRRANDRQNYSSVRERDFETIYIELSKELRKEKRARKLPAA